MSLGFDNLVELLNHIFWLRLTWNCLPLKLIFAALTSQVLWSGSGWNPVPLVDIIEGNAVKRTYQKALLCLHPDKLQQKGATSHEKDIAEKVFDILQVVSN
jgi:hypothetical protein